jgi:hypothetical protein
MKPLSASGLAYGLAITCAGAMPLAASARAFEMIAWPRHRRVPGWSRRQTPHPGDAEGIQSAASRRREA